jgi:hypothetical protein
MKKRKRAVAAKAKKGRKASGSRTKTAPQRAAAPRRASADGAKEIVSKDTAQATIRSLRTKLTQALRRVAELEAAADTDFLLDIPNRRGFERELQRAIAYMKRYRASGALIVLDVDRLKPINDAFGHAAGDQVLKAVAAARGRSVDPNVYRAVANHPRALQKMVEFGTVVYFQNSMTPAQRELAYLTASVTNECHY